jgi:hypothetical protein
MNLSNYGTFDVGNLFFALYQEHEEIDIMTPDAGYYVIGSRIARTASAPENGPIVIYLQATRSVSKFVLSEAASPLSATMFLNAGLNRIYAWASFTGPQPAGAQPYIVNVYGLTVRNVANR